MIGIKIFVQLEGAISYSIYVWSLFRCCSQNYGNVLWMFGAWIIMIGAAIWYAKRKVIQREKARTVNTIDSA